MMQISDVVEAPAVLFLDVPNGSTSAVERMGVVFHSCHKSSHPYSILIVGFWDEDHCNYRTEEVFLMHVIRPISEEEILFRENGGDENLEKE